MTTLRRVRANHRRRGHDRADHRVLDKEAVVRCTGKVDAAIELAVVLAFRSLELNAHPLATGKVRLAYEPDNARLIGAKCHARAFVELHGQLDTLE